MKKTIGSLLLIAVLAFSAVSYGETLYGHREWENVKTGIEAWAWPASGYEGACVNLREGDYDSGFIFGYSGVHAVAEKWNNPLYPSYKLYQYLLLA